MPITVNNAHVPVRLFSRQIASPMRSYCGAFRFVEARPEGPDLFVRYIRVMPFNNDCGEATKIVWTVVRLPNTTLSTFTTGQNLCAVTPSDLTSFSPFLGVRPAAKAE